MKYLDTVELHTPEFWVTKHDQNHTKTANLCAFWRPYSSETARNSLKQLKHN